MRFTLLILLVVYCLTLSGFLSSCSNTVQTLESVPGVSTTVVLSSAEIENPFCFCELLGRNDYYNHFVLQDMLKTDYQGTKFTQTGGVSILGSISKIEYNQREFGDIIVNGTIAYTIKKGSSATIAVADGTLVTNVDTYDVAVDLTFQNYGIGTYYAYRHIQYSLTDQKYNEYNKPTTYQNVDVYINEVRHNIEKVIYPKAT